MSTFGIILRNMNLTSIYEATLCDINHISTYGITLRKMNHMLTYETIFTV